ncbi:proline--tRNA ligase [Acetomicrobium hydrogeniformans ATCC BAA-1850]|uniref:Proline--tRNA ligase n=2 Tax=Acetomicrobium hydrogeniformans TaxID=649746 RepID=A0A0T5XAU4_9BACT|nr:proline--tRNA ligase [Acetomicrobium hydrogeniformans ATCC BAA-1850]
MKMARNITPREKDYSQWYLDVIKAAEMADYAPVRGCMVIRPTGYAIWESIQSQLDERFKETGHVNAYFPLLIPSSFLEKEAKHVEGFSPECAVVTYAGGEELEEPLVIRPTSETVIGHMYSKWIQSWRDLPILINQWCNVLRWEKRPRLFLRTSEFLWQEGHTAHATREEALEETLRMLEVYRSFMEEVLALPVLTGEKSEGERFPGAENTYTCEAMMTDKRALQAGTSHFLGQNFAKAFDIRFQNKDGELEYAWTTSWGVSTRLIGAIIMTHADNDGLVLPPNVAPVKTVILPITPDQNLLQEKILPEAQKILERLKKILGANRVILDTQFHMRPGDRFFYHLQKGVPLRLELGEAEMKSSHLRAVRRDTGEVVNISFDAIEREVPRLLENIQNTLYRRARSFREENTYLVTSFEEFNEVLNKKGGFIKAYFAGSPEDEKTIKEATTATIRCFLLNEPTEGTCFYTKKKGGKLAVFAKAY